MQRPHLIAALIGLGIGLMAGSIDWEKVKTNTAELGAIAVGLGAIASGSLMAFATPPEDGKKNSTEVEK